MTTLANEALRDYELGDRNEMPVIASDIIYGGAFVGDNGSGFARPLVAGDPFRGIAESRVDNSAGAAGAKDVRVISNGLVELAISTLAITDVGKAVYASDDNTFTLTKGTNTRIGYVHRWVSTGVGVIAFRAANGAEAELTDSSGGTASGTIAAIGATYDQAEVRNAVASLAAKINHLLGMQGS